MTATVTDVISILAAAVKSEVHHRLCVMCQIGERCLDGRLLENRVRRLTKGASAR